MKITFTWKHYIVCFAIFILFSWSVVDSINVIIMFFSLVPALVLLLTTLSGPIWKRVAWTIFFFVSATFINFTSTKHSLFYPIAKDGDLTINANATWQSRNFTGSSMEDYSQEKYFEYFQIPCNNITVNFSPLTPGPELPGKHYAVAVKKVVINADFIGTPKTVIRAYLPEYPTNGIQDVFEPQKYWMDGERECFNYNKPLVRGWVVYLNLVYGYILLFSYVLSIVVLVVSVVSFFRNKNNTKV